MRIGRLGEARLGDRQLAASRREVPLPASLSSVTALRHWTRALHRTIDGLLTDVARPDHDGDLAHASDRIRAAFGESPDVVRRRIQPAQGAAWLVCYVDGLVDPLVVDTAVIGPLTGGGAQTTEDARSVVHVGDARMSSRWQTIVHRLSQGCTAVFVAGGSRALLCHTVKHPERSVGRPQTEATIRGPQEGFTEALSTQMAQIRCCLPDPSLRFAPVSIGPQRVAVVSLEAVANPELVQLVRDRLTAIDAAGIVNATMIGALIRDHPLSIFPTIRYTEHVDFLKWHLLQGQVAVLTDGDPLAIVVPATFADFYTTPMDYNTGWYDASFVRVIRVMGFVISLTLPALYIVFTSVNPQLVPYQLLLMVTGSHTGLPFTPFTEALVMIFMIEVIREAALRLPRPLAGALGTMGAIVVGTAIVKSGFVSTQIIVIMTLTALSFFSVPAYELVGTGRLLNLGFMVAGEVLGIFGIVTLCLVVSVSLLSMRSFAVPYLAPIVPPDWRGWLDVWVRAPFGALRVRPRWLKPLHPRWLRASGASGPRLSLRPRP